MSLAAKLGSARPARDARPSSRTPADRADGKREDLIPPSEAALSAFRDDAPHDAIASRSSDVVIDEADTASLDLAAVTASAAGARLLNRNGQTLVIRPPTSLWDLALDSFARLRMGNRLGGIER